MKQYAVVTRVTPVRLGGKVIVHAYGPYASQREAASVAREFKKEALEEHRANRSEVSICKLIGGPEFS